MSKESVENLTRELKDILLSIVGNSVNCSFNFLSFLISFF